MRKTPAMLILHNLHSGSLPVISVVDGNSFRPESKPEPQLIPEPSDIIYALIVQENLFAIFVDQNSDKDIVLQENACRKPPKITHSR